MNIQKKYLPLIIGTAIAVGIFIGGKLNFSDSPDRLFSTNSKKDKLNRLIDYIDYDYVDEVNTDSIVDVTVNGIWGLCSKCRVIKQELKEAIESSW